MKFTRQFETPEIKEVKVNKSKSLTVPGQALTLRKMVMKVQSGNYYGIATSNIGYDSDDENYQEGRPIVIDPSDPINSSHWMMEELKDLKVQKAAAEKAAAAAT